MKVIDGGITSAKGFFAAGCAAGIKKNGSADMAMIYSEVPAEAAGTFTTNVVKAAPVIWDRDIVRSGGLVQAVVINSGVANACTGQLGLSYCRQTAEASASIRSRSLSRPPASSVSRFQSIRSQLAAAC